MNPADASPPRKGAPPKAVIPERATGGRRVAARIVWLVVAAIARTLRWRLEDPYGTLGSVREQPVIFAIWHNRLALSLRVHRRYMCTGRPDRRLAGLVSASRDGGLLARVMELSGVIPVRGSSSRRGARALLELARLGQRGEWVDLALTPDGPRGPRYTVQPGVIATAQLTGRPVVPVSLDVSPHLPLRSWDRFQVPLPFARCRVTVGPLLPVPRDIDEPERERLRLRLQEMLLNLSPDGADGPDS